MTQPVTVRGLEIGMGEPKIIAPIVGKTSAEIVEEGKKIASAGADVIEWRADFYENVKAPAALSGTLKDLRTAVGNVPIIFTVRTDAEGGNIGVTDEEYCVLLKAAAATGEADFVDVELFRCGGEIGQLVRDIQAEKSLTVISNHDFHATPEKDELIRRLRRMEEVGGDILKIAVMPQSRGDVFALLEATSEMAEKYTEKPMITMSMGGLGAISRLTGEIFGSAMTFGTVGKSSAPGQIPLVELRAALGTIHRSYLKD